MAKMMGRGTAGVAGGEMCAGDARHCSCDEGRGTTPTLGHEGRGSQMGQMGQMERRGGRMPMMDDMDEDD